MKSRVLASLFVCATMWAPFTAAQSTADEMIPPKAPAGARILVRGDGLSDPSIAVTFVPAALAQPATRAERQRTSGRATESPARIVLRTSRALEVVVPSSATSGVLRISGPLLKRDFSFEILPQTQFTNVTTITGGPSAKNDPLKAPYAVAIAPSGDLYVADTAHHQVRKIFVNGEVTVVAGSGVSGFTNGLREAARFNSPRGIVFDATSGDLYVSDSGNHSVRRISPDGNVTTIAGSGASGFRDGNGATAEFNFPVGIAVGDDGTIYVADSRNDRIRAIAASGAVRTIAGSSGPAGGMIDGPASAAAFHEPEGLAIADGILYVADTKNHAIRRIANGNVTTVLNDLARLPRPVGISIDGAGNLLIADAAAHKIFKLTLAPQLALATIAGSGRNGFVDGTPLNAEFKNPALISLAGALFVADENNDALRMLCSAPLLTGVFIDGPLTAGAEVRVFGAGFVAGRTSVSFDGAAASSVRWIDSTTIVAIAPAGVSALSAVLVTTCGGSTSSLPVGHDSGAPVIEITNGGVPLTDGRVFPSSVSPVVRVRDDDDPSPLVTILLDGNPFVSGRQVTAEGRHQLTVTALDAAGHSSQRRVSFTIDRTAPLVQVLESGSPLVPGTTFIRDVILTLAITDDTATTTSATLDGAAYVPDTPITTASLHTFSAIVTDAAGNQTTVGPMSFTISHGQPAVTITAPVDAALLSSARVSVRGVVSDASRLVINGADVPFNPATGAFAIDMTLVEGPSAIAAVASDAQGRRADVTVRVVVDTRGPELAILAPAQDSCAKATTLELRGTIADAHLDSVVVKLGATVVPATLDATRTTWSASVSSGADGVKNLVVEARDALGQVTVRQLHVLVDREAPVIELTSSGAPFTATDIGRSIVVMIHATDQDNHVVTTATLDAAPYTSGTSIGAGEHTLNVIATDCAGNRNEVTRRFRIDLDAPAFRNLVPAHLARIGAVPPQMTGETDADVASVSIVGPKGPLVSVPVDNGRFSAVLPFVDGDNQFTLIATDRAGNRTEAPYLVTLRREAAIVEIVENDIPIVSGALFNRDVAPSARANDTAATVTLTIDGAPFTAGAIVSTEGAHVAVATARDLYGHETSAEARFTIDKTGPVVKIVAPQGGAIATQAMAVSVSAGDAVSVVVNGAGARKQPDGSWRVGALPMETLVAGEATTVEIFAVGYDAAGNSGRDLVVLNTPAAAPAIVLTAPADGMLTNRARVDVRGYVVSPAGVANVSISVNGVTQQVALDPSGAFRLAGATLREGANAIAVSAVRNGVTSTTGATVTSDVTPPSLRILESGAPLEDEARFAAQAVLTLDARDTAGAVTSELFVDGTRRGPPHAIAQAGGHLVIATARDAAGNETRVERTLTIGSAAGGACRLEGVDPGTNSVVAAATVTLAGRSGEVAGVTINGTRATIANGSFTGTVDLPREGTNDVVVRCIDANGAPFGEALTLTLQRVTGSPSITIATPAEGEATTNASIAVTGGVSADVTSVEINGARATLTGTAFSLPAVPLAGGTNIIVARARNAANRTAAASRRVTYLKDAPSITITAPVAGAMTGGRTIDVSGAWRNVDPSTIAASAGGAPVIAIATTWNDTSGTFLIANLPVSSGAQTITVTARDRAGRAASATVSIRVTTSGPSISIAQPLDNATFPLTAGDTFVVSGTFSAAPGAIVDVNGVTATITGSTFTAPVNFSTMASGVTPVVARVTQPDGNGAIDSIRVTRFLAAPKVTEVFPAANALEIDSGVLVIALFSNAMDRASLAGALRLETSDGVPVSGTLVVDRDVASFAPSALLTPGARYTLKIATTAKDIAGNALAEAWSSSFFVAATAASVAPTITAIASPVCGQSLDLRGSSAPSARMRIDLGTLSFETTAAIDGSFIYALPIGGRSGYQVVRVRAIGTDGSESPVAEAKFLIDCRGPQVVSSSIDRTANRVTIVFSRAIDPATVVIGSSATLKSGVTNVDATASFPSPTTLVLSATSALSGSVTLTLTDAILGTDGAKLVPYNRTFEPSTDVPQPGDGGGFLAGEVFDATSGRPLPGAAIAIGITSSVCDSRGRYAVRVAEGVHTIRASANGFTTVWRQVVVVAGTGVVPIDINLTKRGDTRVGTNAALTLQHGGDDALTRRIRVDVPAANGSITLTSLGAQSLAGLVPLGWSPLASAEIASDAISIAGATLTVDVPASEITSSIQALTAVRYDEARDQWRVLQAVVPIANNAASLAIDAPGNYALVYPDRLAYLAHPATPGNGAVLEGVTDPCITTPCPDLKKRAFTLDPPVILPDGRSVATLTIEGADPQRFPSGTAVQAWITEELKVADGSTVSDTPFATDLLIYRDLDGGVARAVFHLAPSVKATQVVLESGVEEIAVLPYPGRVDRGSLIGPEGGRVTGDGGVTVEIPAGALDETIRASATAIGDLAQFGTIAGFRIAGAFALSLQSTNAQGSTTVELSLPAKVTLSVAPPATQMIVAELLDTGFGRVIRFAAQMKADGALFSSVAIDRTQLPLDGVIRDGRYLILVAEQPIAFATGTMRRSNNLLAADVRVTPNALGVTDVTRVNGIYNVPVVAKPAAPFTLSPRSLASGESVPYTHATSPEPGEIVHVADQVVTSQPPRVTSVFPADNATGVAVSTFVKVSLEPGIDVASVSDASLVVIDPHGNVVPGRVTTEASSAILWNTIASALNSDTRYTIAVLGSVRGLNGAPLGAQFTSSFTTVPSLSSGEVNPAKIRITIPDVNGTSRVIGDAGALPSNWIGIAVRRNRDFTTNPQATASADGHFEITLAGVTTDDLIDLRVINSAGAVAAVIPLTPFVDENGRAFIAPVSTTPVTFTSIDGISVTVPAGAFDKPTLIRVEPLTIAPFRQVEALDSELALAAFVKLEFAGVARKRLDVSLPIPTSYQDPGRELMLGVLSDSIRGPRVMIVDPIRIDGGRFVTSDPPTATANGRRVASSATTASSARDVRQLLRGINRSGTYAALQVTRGPVSWVTFPSPGSGMDLFWDTLVTLFASNLYLTEAVGHIAIPVVKDVPFTIEGADAATGFRLFRRSYPAPTGGGPIEEPNPDRSGPYPVSISPGRVDAVDVVAKEVVLREIKLKLSQGQIAFEYDGSVPDDLRTPAGVTMQAFNLGNGDATPAITAAEDALALPAIRGTRNDRVLFLSGRASVAAFEPIEILFSEPISENLAWPLLFKVELRRGSVLSDITYGSDFTLDASKKLVTIVPPGSLLQQGASYRVTMKDTIADRNDNKLGQRPTVNSEGVSSLTPARSFSFTFKVRDAAPPLAEFSLVPSVEHPGASLADMAQHGNLLFASTLNGGLLAYDLSNPAALNTHDGVQPKPVSLVPAKWTNASGQSITPGLDEHWGVATDRHGRVYAAGFFGSLSVLRTYSVDDFVAARNNERCAGYPNAPPNALCSFRGSSVIGFKPGSWESSFGEVVITERVQGIPRRIQILAQDRTDHFASRAEFKEKLPGRVTAAPMPSNGEFEKLSVRFTYRPDVSHLYYRSQRVTVVNLTRDLSWSIDVPADVDATLTGVIAAAGDALDIITNLSTYAVVTQFGYGISVHDICAIESNDLPDRPSSYKAPRELIIATSGNIASAVNPNIALSDNTVADASLSAEAALLPAPEGILAYTLAPSRGVLGLGIDMAKSAEVAGTSESRVSRGTGLVVYSETTGPFSPRLNPILQKATSLGRTLRPRYRSIATVSAKNAKDVETNFIFVAAGDLGVLVFDAGTPGSPDLGPEALSSIIWIPDGAVSIRASQQRLMATIVDSTGGVSVVRLDDLDERDPAHPDALFRSAATALGGGAPGAFGSYDPRVIWNSADPDQPGRPFVIGSMPPLLDVDTGILFAGDTMGTDMQAVTVLDSEVRVLDARGPKMTVVDAITPLGVQPAEKTKDGGAAAAEGVFRLEVNMPGSITESLDQQVLHFTASSERVEGVPINTSSAGLPVRIDSIAMRRTVPDDPSQPALRFQKGYNRWMTGPIVAIADLRASKKYLWPEGAAGTAAREAAGCIACERPAGLPPDTPEILAGGRFFRFFPTNLPPALSSLNADGRLERRVPTIMADVVRDPRTQIPAQAPPVATGLLQEVTYMHSGEVESSATDLDAGGRAGWNVTIDRTYRSRVIGVSALGFGWDSSIFRRLRVLPTGGVEYRDGSGEVWTFKKGDADYVPPAGVSLKLVAIAAGGWNLIDQGNRISRFDEMGRLVSESDEFFNGRPDSGNVIDYLYGTDGLLNRVVDPVGRETKLTYAPGGMLKRVTDWRNRTVEYDLGTSGRMAEARLPEVGLYAGATRPTVKYTYHALDGDLTTLADLGAALTSITDPQAVILGEGPRVSFEYADAGNDRGRVMSQTWATGEHATFTWDSPTEATCKDALGQERKYSLVRPENDRAHIADLKELQVPVWSGAEAGQLPESVSENAYGTTPRDRSHHFEYEKGMLKTAKTDGVVEVENTIEPTGHGKGFRLRGTESRALMATTPLAVSQPTISKVLTYQGATTFLDSIAINGASINVRQPNRDVPEPVVSNDGIAARSTYDTHGQVVSASSSGGNGDGAESRVEYFDETAAEAYKRGLPESLKLGGSSIASTRYDYPDESTVIETDDRGVSTTTVFDEWQRPSEIYRSGEPGFRQEFKYDASGRLTAEKNWKDQATGWVTTSYTYDAVGRPLTASLDNVNGTETVTTTTSYDMPGRTVTVRNPQNGITVTHLDRLGRMEKEETLVGATPPVRRTAYDLGGRPVFNADNFAASASAFDGHGRLLATRHADRTVSVQEYDGSGNVTKAKELDTTAAVLSESTMDVTPTGRVRGVITDLGDGQQRSTSYAWDGAGRTTATAVNGRSSRLHFDTAGRFKSSRVGAGSIADVTTAFSKVEALGHDGALTTSSVTTEKEGTPVTSNAEYGSGGEVTRQKVASLEWKQEYNGLGALMRAKVPERPAQRIESDSRGSVTEQTLEDGSKNTFTYDAAGALKRYEDPTNEPTTTDADGIGRPVTRHYADGTTEQVEWDASRVKSVTDRQGRKQRFVYDDAGRLWKVYQDSSHGTALLEELHYDAHSGRLISWKNADCELIWEDFDKEGRPRSTRQIRYRDGQVLDEWRQDHRFNAHGERVNWSMPYGSAAPGDVWTKVVHEDYDAMGNVFLITRAGSLAENGSQSAIMTANYRNAGRPIERVVHPNAGITVLQAPGFAAPLIKRSYGFDAATGQMNRFAVSANGVDVAGSEVTYSGLQVSDAKLLGVSGGERATHYTYDGRSRLHTSIAAAFSEVAVPVAAQTPGGSAEQLSPADFRNGRQRVHQLDDATRAAMRQAGSDPNVIDPPSMTIAERAGGGHKIESIARGSDSRNYRYEGAQVVDDGRFLYEFDAKGRLLRATQKAAMSGMRRIVYFYSPTGRVVGRRAEYSNSSDPAEADWKLEDRTTILKNDGLPADVTFVWDAVSDRLVTVAHTPAPSGTMPHPHRNILKQIIHGGLGYDDPIETASTDPFTEGPVKRLYPVYDEASNGVLQAVIDEAGTVVARNIGIDPFGGEDIAIAGPAVDRVTVEGTRSERGDLSVSVKMHLTESLRATTVASGVRLVAIDATGAVQATAPAAPTLVENDAYTIEWKLTGPQWTTLTTATGATALSIAATNTLRATAWGDDVEVLPAPDWATASQPVLSSPYPVEARESLASLSAFLAGIPSNGSATTTLYKVDTLNLAAGGGGTASNDGLDEIFSARLHAHPFTDPTTHLNYVRARWYDATTGSWLTPDPLGYRDSSNLYAFAGGDPVNGRDPSGEDCLGAGGAVTCSDLWNAWQSLGSTKKEAAKTVARIATSLAGFTTGAGKIAAQMLVAPLLPAVTTYAFTKGVVDAYRAGGAKGVANAALDNGPVVGTFKAVARSIDAYAHGDEFGGGEAMADATVRAEADVALAASLHGLIKPDPLIRFEAPTAPTDASGRFVDGAGVLREANGRFASQGTPSVRRGRPRAAEFTPSQRRMARQASRGANSGNLKCIDCGFEHPADRYFDVDHPLAVVDGGGRNQEPRIKCVGCNRSNGALPAKPGSDYATFLAAIDRQKERVVTSP